MYKETWYDGGLHKSPDSRRVQLGLFFVFFLNVYKFSWVNLEPSLTRQVCTLTLLVHGFTNHICLAPAGFYLLFIVLFVLSFLSLYSGDVT